MVSGSIRQIGENAIEVSRRGNRSEAACFAVRVAVTAAVLWCCPATYAQSPAVAPNTASADEFEQLVESLASRNEPPKLAEGAFIKGTIDPPIFDEKYDWVEQLRVSKALHVLIRRKGEELWPHLVRHLDDQRYSLTRSIDDYGKNLTVGSLCREIARQDVTEPFQGLWPSSSLLPGGLGVIHFARPPWWRTLEEWSRSWKDKQLWELQIELGEWGLQRLEGPPRPLVEPKGLLGMGGEFVPPPDMMMSPGLGKKTEMRTLPSVPAEDNTERIQKTKAVIAAIRRTKTPIIDNRRGPFFERSRSFGMQGAREIRERYLSSTSAKVASNAGRDGLTYLGKTVGEWTVLTTDKDGKIRAQAARVLGVIDPAAKSSIPPLARLLEDKEPQVRRAAAMTLPILLSPNQKGRSKATPAIPALTKLLDDEDRETREAAARCLAILGPEAKSAIPRLIDLLKDEHAQVRSAAAEALRGILVPGAKATEVTSAVPALTQLLDDRDPTVRRVAATTLRHLGPEAKSSIPALTKLLGDNDRGVRAAAASALGAMGPDAKPAIPDLVESLKDVSREVRMEAVSALRRLGPDGKSAVPSLIQLMTESAWSRQDAAAALGNIGPEASPAIPALMEMLKAKDPWDRSAAAKALGKIGPDAKPAVPALKKLLKDGEGRVDQDASEALYRIDGTITEGSWNTLPFGPDWQNSSSVPLPKPTKRPAR